jgi:hypothetical protein
MKMYGIALNLSFVLDVKMVISGSHVLHFQGIQAQTVANFFLAFEAQLSIIPVINKVITLRQ